MVHSATWKIKSSTSTAAPRPNPPRASPATAAVSVVGSKPVRPAACVSGKKPAPARRWNGRPRQAATTAVCSAAPAATSAGCQLPVKTSSAACSRAGSPLAKAAIAAPRPPLKTERWLRSTPFPPGIPDWPTWPERRRGSAHYRQGARHPRQRSWRRSRPCRRGRW